MYFPYFRGKQYELITIRENAGRLAESEFVPVIEPVKETLGGLEKALEAVCDAGGKAIVIVNPRHGVHSHSGESISLMLKKKYADKPGVAAGVLLTENMSVEDAIQICDAHRAHELMLVHAGFTHGKALHDGLNGSSDSFQHLFVGDGSKLYRRLFKGSKRVLIKDGFIRRRNKDHPNLEFFSDLHATYVEEGMNGFGDFLTVGDDFLEGGGPAYAIAIHLSFIDPDDEGMYIYHFKSKRTDTPADPAGKFGEALDTMIEVLNEKGSKVLETEAVAEFRQLHTRRHFPGLGYVKKLSMQHHIETMAAYFALA
jgi:hypothetical protein